MDPAHQRVFITGGTGYIGSRLIPSLLQRGHEVIALAREQSKQKLPPQCSVVMGNALDGSSYADHIDKIDTFIHLVGVSHPSPAKARQFIEVDQRSALEAIRVAASRNIAHFIYVSVAHPAPVMKAYIEARMPCEESIRQNNLNATILRPWYVLGPGHRWAYLLIPMYRIAEAIPRTRAGALRLGLITVDEMVKALLSAVSNPARGVRVFEVPEMRELARTP